MYNIGIDIGGTFTKAGLVEGTRILYKTQIQTPKNMNSENFFELTTHLIETILAYNNLTIANIKAIGIGIAGMVLADKGALVSAGNLGLSNLDIATPIQKQYGVPVKIANDVACFALAQSKISKIDNLVYITIGTGINAGVINKGKLFSGAHGASIEYGHTFLMATADKCACGRGGCIEQFINAKKVQENNDFLPHLTTVLLNIINTFRPEEIFIGGGGAQFITPFLDDLDRELARNHYGYKNAQPVRVEISKISTEGGIIGATLL